MDTAAKDRLRLALVYLLLFFFCCALSWRSGVFQSEFGRYQDEGMHYLTGLFIQDFLTSGHWTAPMQFARQYYLHLPKIALGNWPPGFPLMQTVWGLIFGDSRTSMMFGMIALTAWLAWLVYRAAERYFGPALARLGAILLIAAPLTQQHTAMVMAEIPLAAASFLAIAAFVRFLDLGRRRDALAFALWTFAAIMIKGNGWVIVIAAPAILVCTGRLRLLRNSWLWIACLLIGLLCVPYTLITMHIIAQGWDTNSFPGFAYEWASLGKHLGFVAGLLGIPLAVVAVFGALFSILRMERGPVSRRDPFWIAMVVYGAAIVLFHVAVPSSIEPRKIYQIMPVICLLTVAGIAGIAALLPKAVPARKVLVSAAALLVFLFTGFSLLPLYSPGFGPAVAGLVARPDTRGAAILVSSNPQWADSEAAVIAEWAERRRNDGTFLIRGTKLLSHQIAAGPGQPAFALNFTDRASVLKALADIPVSFVILHSTEAAISYPHQALLEAALAGDPAEWERIYYSRRYLPGLDQTHVIQIYRCRRNLVGAPIHYSVDLSKKIGEEIGTQP